MTAATFKDGVLAVDSMVSRGDRHGGTFHKWCAVPKELGGGFIVGAGRIGGLQHLFNQVAAGTLDLKVPPGNGNEELLRMDAKGDLYQWDDVGVWIQMQGRAFAVGSAAEFCQGAMLSGASAVDAIKLAAEHMNGVGYPVHSFHHTTRGIVQCRALGLDRTMGARNIFTTPAQTPLQP